MLGEGGGQAGFPGLRRRNQRMGAGFLYDGFNYVMFIPNTSDRGKTNFLGGVVSGE